MAKELVWKTGTLLCGVAGSNPVERRKTTKELEKVPLTPDADDLELKYLAKAQPIQNE